MIPMRIYWFSSVLADLPKEFKSVSLRCTFFMQKNKIYIKIYEKNINYCKELLKKE